MNLVKQWLIPLVILLIVGCNSELEKPIPEDSLWSQHQLENGLRYHLYPTDDKEVSIRLMIHTGSLQESSEQRGYAHFVEHMAFNGSRNFTGNDVIKLFERTGGTFGPDINAFTGYQLTAYKMDLSDKDHLSLALTWMKDVADGLEFTPEQVEREKGVILGEFRATRSENEPLITKAYLAAIKGSILDDRDPLGTEEAVKQATPQGLIDYYQTWYQPQNAELVIAGNINPEELSKLITEQFSSWQSNGQPAVEKQRGVALDVSSRNLPVGEMESPSVHLIVDRGPIAIKNHKQQYQFWLDDITQQLISQRLNTALNDAAIAIQFAGSYSQWLDYDRLSVASIEFASQQREATQQLFLETIRSLRDHGVSQNEFDSVMTSYKSALANLDSDWDKRKPMQIVDEKILAIEQAMPVQSYEFKRSALGEFITHVDLERVNNNMDDLLSSDVTWLQGYAGNESVTELESMLAQLPNKYQQWGSKPLALQAVTSEILQPESAGEIVSRSNKERELTVWQLGNGVEVWYQRDSKAGKRAHVVYASQGGKAALSPELYAASNLLVQAAARSGLGEFNGSQFDSFLRKKDIAVYPFVGFTSHGIEINSAAKELSLALNVIFNISKEIKVEPRQLEVVKQEFYQDNNTFFASPEGQWYKAINASTYRSNSRHRFITNSDLATVTEEQLFSVHKQLFNYNRANKLVIIADLEPIQVASMLRKYIAPIAFNPQQASPLNFDNGYYLNLTQQLDVPVSYDKGTTILTRLVNTQTQPKSAKDLFAEDALQRIASARLLDEVREKRGFDYSPEVYPVTQDSELVSDWFVSTKVASKDVKEVQQALDAIFKGLANSVTEQEKMTALKQLVNALEPLDNDPGQRAWFYSRYLVHGYGLDALLNIETTANSISLSDIQQRANWVFGANSEKITATLSPSK